MIAKSCTFALWLALLSLALVSSTFAAELRVQVDRERVALDEVIELRLIAEGDLDAEPDFTPLERDFDILRRGQSQMTSILNGRMSQSRQWSLELAPKRTGRLTIPALHAGADHSEPLTLEIVAPGQAETDAAGPRTLFIEVEAKTTTPYVQQPLIYRVKVYYRQPPQRAVLSEPQIDGATVERLGEDHAYDDQRNGLAYRVIERRYRLTPQRSGVLTIQSPRLEATLDDPRAGARQDPFAELDQAFGGRLFQGFPTMPGATARGRRVVERAPDLELSVRPQPTATDSGWLPATSVQLSEEWAPSPPRFQVGEPVTRTLTITAEGTTAAQLPDLSLGALDGVQVYPDQPRGEDLTSGPAPAALKTLKFALVPSRPGLLTLPEIRLNWWDTRTDRAQVAVIPARTVEVVPAPGSSLAATPPLPAVPQAAADFTADPISTTAPPATDSADSGWGMWPWLALIGVLLSGWGATVYLWQRERRARTAAAPSVSNIRPPAPAAVGLDHARRALQTACAAEDPRAARAALLDWARARWPERTFTGLEALAEAFADAELSALLRDIDRAIYAAPGEFWDGTAVWASLEPHLDGTRSDKTAAAAPIPELYPRI